MSLQIVAALGSSVQGFKPKAVDSKLCRAFIRAFGDGECMYAYMSGFSRILEGV